MIKTISHRIADLFRPRPINEKIRLYLYDGLRLTTLPFYFWYRWRFRNLREGKLILGSGARRIKDWINLELNPVYEKDIWYDFRNRLPFADNSIRMIYSSHVFEHLFIHELKKVLQECRRVLMPGGILRVCVPSLEKYVEAYLKKDETFIYWDPKELNPFEDFSYGAKFSRALFLDGAHKNFFDFGSFEFILDKMGFQKVSETEFQKSSMIDSRDLYELEPEEMSLRMRDSLFVEAVR